MDIVGLAFTAVSITRGGTVTWTNRDPVEHDVSSDTKAFQSPILPTGATFSARFDQAGVFPYVCSLHPSMTSTVTVR